MARGRGNTGNKAWSIRVAELSQAVADWMKLSPRQIDDIRVAALLHDIGNIEVTTKVIRRAVGVFEDEGVQTHKSTFRGADLMLSLGAVLNGAVPLLLRQGDGQVQPNQNVADSPQIPVGAKIIRTVRAYLLLAESPVGGAAVDRAEILRGLRTDKQAGHDPAVLNALERTLARCDRSLASAFIAPNGLSSMPAANTSIP